MNQQVRRANRDRFARAAQNRLPTACALRRTLR
jgi:hypothetical protein